jgi:hypothetical protein
MAEVVEAAWRMTDDSFWRSNQIVVSKSKSEKARSTRACTQHTWTNYIASILPN